MSRVRLHQFLDTGYGRFGDRRLRAMLRRGADPNARGPSAEPPLHVATRRRRLTAVVLLLDFGADIDARTGYGKTAYVHAARRGFTEVCDLLRRRGANCSSVPADRLAMALSAEDLDKAEALLAEHPDCAKTGNPEEDRLLADMAGRNNIDAVRMLVDAGADLVAPGLDDGTPLHQAAWFGQPANVRLLIDRGAPLDVFERVHGSSPLGWAVHGSRHSGGAAKRQRAYLDIVDVLIRTGSSLHYPDDPSNAYYRRLMRSGSRKVRQRLRASWHG